MLDSGLVNQGSQTSPTLSSDGSRITLDRPPVPKQKWVLTPESFDQLLVWLNQDRDLAAEKYEEMRSQLIKRFRQLGCREAEDLANETLDRVAQKLPDIVANYQGEREPYVFSVAYYVHKEHTRKPVLMSLADSDFQQTDISNSEEEFEKELLDSCLKHCMEKLDHTSQEMIIDYYQGERQDKIKSRQLLADRLGIKLANLRLRAQRVRTKLKECILECAERKTMKREVVM